MVWTGMHSLFSGDLTLPGQSNLWMFFIYGCAVFLEPLHDAIAGWNWMLRGIVWVIVIWIIEYASGSILYNVLGAYPWYYSDRLAVDGLITLAYAPAWFVAGLIFEKFHRSLDRYGIA